MPFHLRTLKVNAAASTTTSQSFVYQYPISLIRCYANTDDDMDGDSCTLTMDVDSGYTTANIGTSDTELFVDSDTMQHILEGQSIQLGGTSIFSTVIARNIITSSVTLETSFGVAFSSGATITVRTDIIDVEFGPGGYYPCEGEEGYMSLPANVPFFVNYTRNKGTATTFRCQLEYRV